MTSIEFDCPHCSGRFELENPPAGGRVGCPLCGQTLAIPAELPVEQQRDAADSSAPDRGFDVAQPPDVAASPLAFDVDEFARSKRQPRGRGSQARDDKPAVVELSREEKERRRQIRSLVCMIAGAVLLVIAVAVLSRL